MELTLDRLYKKATYTIGNLSIDGKFVCNVLEDTDRGLTDNMSEDEIRKKKVYAQTAIPSGRYKVIFAYSAKFCNCDYAINSMIPLLLGVKGFTAIRMHAGNTDKDSAGCLILGENRENGKVIYSGPTCKRVFAQMWTAYNYGSPIWLTIK